MAISAIHLFDHTTEANAAAQVAALTAGAAANPPNTTNPTTPTDFAAILGQLLAELGPLAFNNTLTNIGSNNPGGTSFSSFTSILFDLLLFNSLGLGQITTQPTVQQLLLTQLLATSSDSTNSLGLGGVADQSLATTREEPGTVNDLLVQLDNVSTQPDPVVFSAAVLAQAFQIGNGTGSPA